MRCAEALVKALELEGVRYVFGHPGHGNTNILDAIYDSSQIEFMLTRHEQGAAHIADGYARISGEIGVCCASVGPGPANMVMGLASAAAASSPVVAIFGGVISRWVGRGQLQETSPFYGFPDQSFVQVLQPVVKKVWQLQHPDLIPEVVRKACALARAGNPGPVAIEIPWDLQAAFHDFAEIPDPSWFGYAGRCAGRRAGDREGGRCASRGGPPGYRGWIRGCSCRCWTGDSRAGGDAGRAGGDFLRRQGHLG